MHKSPIEAILGAVVLLIAVSFLIFSYMTLGITLSTPGYPIKAVFSKVGGLQRGADVRISGIKVGTVTNQTLDPVVFTATIHMNIKTDVHLPSDTVVSIANDGLFGSKYVRLEPGHARDFFSANEVITKTKDFKSLEEVVSEIIFFTTQGEDVLQ